MSEPYEMISTTEKDNLLTVDFAFTNEVDKQEAVQLIDNLVSMLDDSTDAVAKELLYHKPTYWEWNKNYEGEVNNGSA